MEFIAIRQGLVFLDCYLDLLLGEVTYRREVLVAGLRCANTANTQLSVVKWLMAEVPVARQVWVQPLYLDRYGRLVAEVFGTEDSPRSASLTAFMLREWDAKAAGRE